MDPVRGLLVYGSLVNNSLEVIDLKTSKRLHGYHVAPWLHVIALDYAEGAAHVSAIGVTCRPSSDQWLLENSAG